jgi:hypothetical protein
MKFRVVYGGKIHQNFNKHIEVDGILLSQWYEFSKLSENQRKLVLKGFDFEDFYHDLVVSATEVYLNGGV